jgi:hypothetical protein
MNGVNRRGLRAAAPPRGWAVVLKDKILFNLE